MDDLFSHTGQGDKKRQESSADQASAEAYFHPGTHAPLAVRMRPRTLD